jgi:hypothetical protein
VELSSLWQHFISKEAVTGTGKKKVAAYPAS